MMPTWKSAPRNLTTLPVVLALGLVMMLWGGAGAAAAAQQVITSTGPLNNIYLSDDLACQADHVGDAFHEFYHPLDAHGDCGTFLWPGGVTGADQVYGPQGNADGNARLAYTLVSQTPVTGSGTSGDPYKVITVVDAGSTGLRITQTDSYVVGNEFYRTDIEVSNSTNSNITAALYHAADCFLQDSDDGYGFYDASAGGIYCSKTPNNSPPDRIEGFVPQSAGSHYIEDFYSTVWDAIDGSQFPDTCACALFQDNGAGLSWSITVPANGSVTRSLLTNFSPTGVTPAGVGTSLSGGGQSGPHITVPSGTTVTDSATLTGANSATADGMLTYTVYSDSTCSTVYANAGTVTVTNGNVPDSDPVTFTQAGVYYWVASYSGDADNDPASSGCGNETVTVEGGVGPPATLTLSPDTATNRAGEQHCVTATVEDANGTPVPGVTVQFSVSGANSASGSATTDSNGEATFCYTGTNAGNDTINAFADVNTNGTDDGASEPDDTASKTYVAADPATLDLTPATATNVVDSQHCVTAHVEDAFGNPTPGITVRFSTSGSTSASGSGTTNSTGDAQFCYTGPALPGADTIRAFADTNTNGTDDGAGEPDDTATKTWVVPANTTGCKITDGGRIKANNGDKATFGANAHATTPPKGQQNYQDHGPAQPMHVKSLKITAVTCSTDRKQGSIFGTATINGSGNYNYRIDVQDLGEPGWNDTYRIRLSNGYDSGQQTLEGGNIQIHH